MVIKELHIDSFGKLKNFHMNPDKGINIIFGENESGKSTLCQFVSAMLFGLAGEKGKSVATNLYMKNEPWDGANVYGGWIKLKEGQDVYLIKRNFYKNNRKFSCINETTGEDISEEAYMHLSFMKGFTKGMFDNMACTVLLKGTVKNEMAGKLTEYVNNSRINDGIYVDVQKARNELDKKRKKIDVYNADSEIELLSKRIKEDEYSAIKLDEEEKRTKLAKMAIERFESTKPDSKVVSLEEYIGEYDDILSTYHEMKKMKKELDIKTGLAIEKEKTAGGYARSTRIKVMTAFVIVLLSIIAIGAGLIDDKAMYAVVMGVVVIVWLGIYFTFSHRICYMLVKMRIEDEAYLQTKLDEQIKENEKKIEQAKERICKFAQRAVDISSCANMEEVMDKSGLAVSKLKDKVNEYYNIRDRKRQELDREYGACLGRVESLRKLMDDGEQRRQQLKELLADYNEMENKVRALELAKKVINQSMEDVNNSFGQYIGKRVGDNIGAFTLKQHTGVLIDEKLNVKIRDNGQYKDVASFSTGAIEQINLGMRFAIKDISGYNGPMLFDDAFACYDDKRLKTVLCNMTQNVNQIFIMTCTGREESLLKEINIGYTLCNM